MALLLISVHFQFKRNNDCPKSMEDRTAAKWCKNRTFLCAYDPLRAEHDILMHDADRWMDHIHFSSFSTVFQSFPTVFLSYQDNWRVILQACVQWNLIYSRMQIETAMARSAEATRDLWLQRYNCLLTP